jgi:hypothetical protein
MRSDGVWMAEGFTPEWYMRQYNTTKQTHRNQTEPTEPAMILGRKYDTTTIEAEQTFLDNSLLCG